MALYVSVSVQVEIVFHRM